MKNIHVLPTDKPSRLYLTTHEYIFEEGYSLSTDECENKHIYITNDEEIKEGDWCIYINTNQIFQVDSYTISNHIHIDANLKKIILTTDQDLIGVQTIDDEFLEWFVKNPSCEEVEVKRKMIIEYEPIGHAGGVYVYKIIIPKEESKKEYRTCKCVSNWFNTTVADKPFCFKCGESVKEDFKPTEETCTCTDECLGYLTKTCKGIETLEQIDQNNPVTRGSTALLYKQETLEEAAKRIYPINIVGSDGYDGNFLCRTGFYIGYELAKERSYSEQEVFELLQNFNQNAMEYIQQDERNIMTLVTLKKWFKQFKKK